ncbi:3-deoxy-D-manno-octulosonic acid transferase [Limnohabitans sp. MMS-10A-178]|uniref:3-deoxy-D-manno-octulosonic acid transferase n=1 Tax=Limnohabitans sp. MMS-10A-178 TaxID=1835767 RepID=UPI000D33B508|nr:3-deoxy-D-manno-octulosonic acid transferase [Limnohabitans sp. MMS-10A-178]PUE17064.1 3-deoxy-D-manno-octulosonic acid transferase [Limnohabitans sp. MMS-10A-178]
MPGFSLWLYGVIMRLAQALLRRKLRKRAQAEPLYGQYIEERFGYYKQSACNDWIWIHAVSLGETRTAAILLQGLRQAMPHMKLLLTNGTATGREEGLKLLQEGDIQVWQAWDSPEVVERFLTAFKPRIGLLLETEVWPQLIHKAQEKGIPIMLINARMSEKSLHQAQRWASLIKPAFAGLSAVCAQAPDDAMRLKSLGASVTGIFGNLKFDAKPDASQVAMGRAWREQLSAPVVMLASSREGEEAMWLAAWQTFNKQHPELQIHWLIVPRHPQRVSEVESLITSSGLRVSRRSTWSQEALFSAALLNETAQDSSVILLGDSLGEMALYYSLADAALLGGSFEKLGGQNLIEAAACACPIVMGPHTFNFAEASQAAETAGAAQRASDMAAAMKLAADTVQNRPLQKQKSANAFQFAQQHGGATQRTVQAVLAQLKIKD